MVAAAVGASVAALITVGASELATDGAAVLAMTAFDVTVVDVVVDAVGPAVPRS